MWRRDWVNQLSETENYFDNFFRTYNQPYALIYTTDLQYGQVNYRTETLPISFNVLLREYANWTNVVEKTVQTMLEGLNKTGRKDTWEIGNWPQRNITNLNPFKNGNKDFSVAVELVNSNNKIIGRQTFTVRGSWQFNFTSGVKLSSSTSNEQTVVFPDVNVNDITDVLTIRFATINRQQISNSENNLLMITTRTNFRDANGYDFHGFGIDGFNRNGIDKDGYDRNGFNREGFSRNGLDKNGFSKTEISYFTISNTGTITSYKNPTSAPIILNIPPSINGIAVIRIARNAFITGNYSNNQSIRYWDSSKLKEIIIPQSVRVIEGNAFPAHLYSRKLKITIGSNVTLGGRVVVNKGRDIRISDSHVRLEGYQERWDNSFGEGIVGVVNANIGSKGFDEFYKKNGRKAGTYTDCRINFFGVPLGVCEN
jgi:hypothetical protein